MFSNLRNVVEGLAQPISHHTESQENSPETERANGVSNHARSPGSGSFDLSSVAHSTGHLAESAFSSFRKTLVAQRPFGQISPTSEGVRASASSPQPDRELKPVGRTTLEDRLRASFAIGDISKSPTPTPEPSHAPSPKPAPIQPASPTSIPLPDSPPDTPTLAQSIPLPLSAGSAALSDPLSTATSPVITPENSDRNPNRIQIEVPNNHRYPEADVPLPAVSPMPTNLTASQSRTINSPSSSDSSGLTERYVELGQRFKAVQSQLEQMSTSQDAILAVLLELTPVSSLSDATGLRDHLQNLNTNANVSREELRRLNGKLSTYDSRLEELRDTHRLESRSQIELVTSLRKQLAESEALLKAAQGTSLQSEEVTRKLQKDVDDARAETQRLKETVKEEEEKRTKAISLLKTVRQKLVKAEKERDDALKEVVALKEKEKAAQEREKAEKARFEKEIENLRLEKERDIIGLKNHFDREAMGAKERAEKEISARRGQLELEIASIKASLQKDITAKASRIQSLETSVRSLSTERDSLFDQLQLRQTELESSQSHLETLQSRTSELQFQLREVTDRSALLAEELSDAQRELEYKNNKPSESTATSEQTRASLEAKYEVRINELMTRLADLEKDRNETEAAMSRSLQQKAQEAEALRQAMEASSESQGVSEEEMNKLQQTIDDLQRQVRSSQEQHLELERQKDRVNDLEAQLQKQASDFAQRLGIHEDELKEAKEREAQTRTLNKNLREELRKVQNSAALLERQRNPGVGYWSTIGRHENNSEAAITSPTPSTPELPRVSSPPVSDKASEEEVNLEYVRNVILQFLENKEARPHLVRVLSIILHFTPQETRRLIAKV